MAAKQKFPAMTILALLGAGWYFSSKKEAVENLDYSLANFSLVEAQPLQLLTEADFVVTNTQPLALRISNLVGSVYSGSIRVATFAFPDVRLVPPAGTKPFKMPIRIPTLKLAAAGISNISRLIRGEEQRPFRFVGSVRINGISYPFDIALSLLGNGQS